MANPTIPIGMAVREMRNGASAPALRACLIPDTYATALFVGDPIAATGAWNTVKTFGYEPGALPVANRAVAAGPVDGVIVSFLPKDFLSDTYGAASTMRVALAVDPANIVFAIRASGSLPAAMIGKDASPTFATSGNTVTGISGVELDVSTVVADTTLPLHIVGIEPAPENTPDANAIVLVTVNPAAPVIPEPPSGS